MIIEAMGDKFCLELSTEEDSCGVMLRSEMVKGLLVERDCQGFGGVLMNVGESEI